MQKKDIFNTWNCYRSDIQTLVSANTLQKSDAEDIVQEVFIKFWTKHNEIRDNNKTLFWLLHVARNTIADYYRKKDNVVKKIRSDTIQINFEDEQIKDGSKKLIPIINSLPVIYKTALLLSEIYGLPHKEIAEQLGLTVTCIKTRVIRARKLLAEKMHACCSFEYDKYGNIIDCSDKPAYIDCLKKSEKK